MLLFDQKELLENALAVTSQNQKKVSWVVKMIEIQWKKFTIACKISSLFLRNQPSNFGRKDSLLHAKAAFDFHDRVLLVSLMWRWQ